MSIGEPVAPAAGSDESASTISRSTTANGEQPPFRFDRATIALPDGAFARTHRRWLTYGNRKILAIAQGACRPYCYPLLSPAGYTVTSESPADHPHHNSLWLGADHVHRLVPVESNATETYTYNFYVNETFQGRAAGQQRMVECSGKALDATTYQITQVVNWIGPSEWAAPDGRHVLSEQRYLTVHVEPTLFRIDISSILNAVDYPVQLGPTRHAFFNVRVAETLAVEQGGIVSDERGPATAAEISRRSARWVDYRGPVGGGAVAGVTVIPTIANAVDASDPADQLGDDGTSMVDAWSWFVSDWGVVSVGNFRDRCIGLKVDTPFTCRCTILVHDGALGVGDIDSEARRMPHVPSLSSGDR